MRSGDFETLYNALPESVKKQTKSTETIQDSWNEAAEKLVDCRKIVNRKCPAIARMVRNK